MQELNKDILSKDIARFIELLSLSNQRTQRFDQVELDCHRYALERLMRDMDIAQVFDQVLHRLCYIAQEYGSYTPSRITVIEDGKVSDVYHTVALCQLCYKQACYKIVSKNCSLYLCADHDQDTAYLFSYITQRRV